MDIHKVKIQIDDMYWIFDDAYSVEVPMPELTGSNGPLIFHLTVKTFPMPTIFRKVQDGNVTKYEKLPQSR